MKISRPVPHYLLYTVVIWCICSIKVNLIGVGDGGIRVDDFLILGAALLLFSQKEYRRLRLSAWWNGFIGRVPTLYASIFVLRLVEYLVFYYLGYFLSQTRFNLRRWLTVYLWLLAVVVPLQIARIIPVFGSFTAERAIGNTNGPYELSAVAAFLLCYLAYDNKQRLAGSAAFVILLATASRITSVAAIVSLVKISLTRVKSKQGFLASVTGLVAGGLLLVFLYFFASTANIPGLDLFNRLNNSEGMSWSQVQQIYGDAPVFQNSAQYAAKTGDLGEDLTDFKGDLSSFGRYTHWITLIKNTLSHPDSIFIGIGPSFGTLAVDGYFVRVFAETGILGFICFIRFVWALGFEKKNSSWPFREFIFIMALIAIYIDIFSSYHPMVLLWLWHGMNQYKARPIPAHIEENDQTAHLLPIPA
jgi:hypothetical protein